jgi:hypothetical protein
VCELAPPGPRELADDEGRPSPSQAPLRRGPAAVVTESTPGRRGGSRESRSPEDGRSQPPLQTRSAAAVRASPPLAKPMSGPPEAVHRDAAARHRLSRHLDDGRSPPLLGRLPRAAEATAVSEELVL